MLVTPRRNRSTELTRLVLTKQHEQLLNGVGTLAGPDTVTVVNLFVSPELRERADAFGQAIEALRQIVDRWYSTDLVIAADISIHPATAGCRSTTTK